MIPFTLYSNYRLDKPTETVYDKCKNIKGAFDLQNIGRFDHTAAAFGEWHTGRNASIFEYKPRCYANFFCSNVVMMDLDNTHTDTNLSWITEADLFDAFEGVHMLIATSRNHLKRKDGKSCRPKYHVYFPLMEPVYSPEEYQRIKLEIWERFPEFDKNALDAPRFFFGNPVIVVYARPRNPETRYITDWIKDTPKSVNARVEKNYGTYKPIIR